MDTHTCLIQQVGNENKKFKIGKQELNFVTLCDCQDLYITLFDYLRLSTFLSIYHSFTSILL